MSVTYPGVLYFRLAKEMPLCPVGTVVNICEADGREKLYVDSIEMPIDIALRSPDFFVPIDLEQHQKLCYQNTIKYFIDNGRRTRKEAKRLLNEMDNDLKQIYTK
jgi:hypothetical protein